jgi:hypothetical protein
VVEVRAKRASKPRKKGTRPLSQTSTPFTALSATGQAAALI